MHDRSSGGQDGPEALPLVGDGVTPGIVRVGDTVRRPLRPFSGTVQAYLAHLHRNGFTDAPVPLGTDEQGREVLTYVPGDVPREPLPAETAGEDVLAALARLIRRLHEAAAGWTPPADATWGGIPGSAAAGREAVEGAPELVGHRDYCPGNVVFRDGLPAALIDFDLARPTTRLYEIANALYWWVPLLDPRDRAPGFADLDAARRVSVFVDAYGLTGRRRAELVPLATRMIHRFHTSARAAADRDPVFHRLWEEGVKDRMPRAESWIAREGPAIAALITP
ncbi:phosphotransferase enzyme family protein [Nocardiopsis flavescens]